MDQFKKQNIVVRYVSVMLCSLSISVLPGLSALAPVDHDTEGHIEAARDLVDEVFLADCNDSDKAATWGNYNYLPHLRKILDVSRQRTFQLSSHGKVLLAPKPEDPHSSFWIVHPISKLKMENNIDRMPVKSKGYLRAANPIVDINGDGKPEIIVGSRDFSAHGTWHYWIYSLGERAKLYAEMPDTDLWQTLFADLNADGKYEAICFDMVFQGWYDALASAAAPCVVLSAGPSGFRLDPNLMHRPALSEAELNTMAASIKKEFQAASSYYDSDGVKESKAVFVVSPRLWRVMIDLIYSGNSRQCWELLEQTWPKGKTVLLTTCAQFQPSENNSASSNEKLYAKTKEKFVAEFLKQLSDSIYFEDLCQLNASDTRLKELSVSSSQRASTRSTTKSKPAADETLYKRYLNARYKFGIDYPASFKAGAEPDNGDGLTFSSSDGKTVLTAYGMNLNGTTDGEAWTADSLLNSEIENHRGANITLKTKGASWVVISGYEGNEIFYFRGIIGKDGVKCFQLKYPKEQKSNYDKIVAHLAKSLRNTL